MGSFPFMRSFRSKAGLHIGCKKSTERHFPTVVFYPQARPHDSFIPSTGRGPESTFLILVVLFLFRNSNVNELVYLKVAQGPRGYFHIRRSGG